MDFSLDNKQRRKIEELLRSNFSGKVQKRLFALLWLDDGKAIAEVADLLHVSQRCLRDWLRIFRNKGFDALLVLTLQGRCRRPDNEPNQPAQAGSGHRQVPLRSPSAKIPPG